jgi:hypothetical protein
MSAEGAVFYLKHLRELAGPDCLVITEHGFDATHVFAAIWPSGEDDQGKRPLDEFARWLVPGSVEVVRVKNAEGARRAWAEGGTPLVNDSDVGPQLMAIQDEFVLANRASRVRPDVPAPGAKRVEPAEPAKP